MRSCADAGVLTDRAWSRDVGDCCQRPHRRPTPPRPTSPAGTRMCLTPALSASPRPPGPDSWELGLASLHERRVGMEPLFEACLSAWLGSATSCHQDLARNAPVKGCVSTEFFLGFVDLLAWEPLPLGSVCPRGLSPFPSSGSRGTLGHVWRHLSLLQPGRAWGVLVALSG